MGFIDNKIMSAIPLLKIVLLRAIENKCKNMLEPTINMLMAFSAAAAGALLLASSSLSSAFSENQVLLCVCLAGGIGGGIISVVIFPNDTIKKTAFKWLASSLASGLFSPAIAQYLSIQQDLVYILALSAGIGLFSWGVILVVVPIFGTNGVIYFLIRRWFGIDVREVIKKQKEEENPEAKAPDWIEVRKSKRD